MPLSLDGLPAAAAWQAVAGRSVWWNAAAGDAASAAITRLARQMRFTRPPLDVERGFIAAIRTRERSGSMPPLTAAPAPGLSRRAETPRFPLSGSGNWFWAGKRGGGGTETYGGVAGQRPEDLFLRGPWWTAFWLRHRRHFGRHSVHQGRLRFVTVHAGCGGCRAAAGSHGGRRCRGS